MSSSLVSVSCLLLQCVCVVNKNNLAFIYFISLLLLLSSLSFLPTNAISSS